MKILVGFDGSEQSLKALHFALDIAKCKENSELIILSIIQTPEFAEMVEIEEYIDNAKQYYMEQFEKIRKLAGDIKIETKTLIGHAAEQIVKYSKENKVDIIVVGKKGKSKLEDFIIGSVSRRLAAYSPCTVIIVK